MDVLKDLVFPSEISLTFNVSLMGLQGFDDDLKDLVVPLKIL